MNLPKDKIDFVNQGYKLAVENLLLNSHEHGMMAARPAPDLEKLTYAALYPRDVGVSVLGMLASDDDKLINLAKISLESLAKSQSPRGQFPQAYKPESNFVEWWHPGTIDGTLWWSIAVLEYVKKTNDTAFYEKYKGNIEKAFTWLAYQDTNNDCLLEQGESAGWDDEMPRHGTVLYTNALWYWLLKLRIEVEKRNDLKNLKDYVYEGVNTFLWIQKVEDNKRHWFPENNYTKNNAFSFRFMEYVNAQTVYLPYYLGYVSHLSYEQRCETYGNILACIVGLADEEKQKIITDFMFGSGVNVPYPVKVMYPPIYPGEEDWKSYMKKGRQNYPWQYHNAGIWPYIGGFWVKWLAQYNHPKAGEEFVKLANMNAVNDWQFNEYFHGQHGTPMGIAYQSWNMAMYIYAYKSVIK